jgi:uncharacterized protein YqgV (UPF0045/DUF77 family)
MQVLSFDVGIRHMAYCLLDEQEMIHEWRVIDLGCRKNDSQKIIDNLIDLLDEIYHHEINQDEPLTVLIESQMTSVMRSIQVAINTFFKVVCRYNGHDIKTKYMSGKRKMDLIQCYKEYVLPENIKKIQSNYKRNKLLSCDFTRWYLCNIYEKHNENCMIEKIIDKSEPDMSDAFLQGIAFIKKCVI